MATPLAVVLAELLQNAVEHAFLDFEARRTAPARGAVDGHDRTWAPSGSTCPTEEACCGSRCVDDGSGLPEGFDIDDTQSLGLSIVRDLVRSQLDGTITMETGVPGRRGSGDPGGHRVPVREPQPIGQ